MLQWPIRLARVGLVEEESGGRISARYAYVAVIGLGIALVWMTNVFEIIALASRAFAAYYLSQALSAFQIAGHRPEGPVTPGRQDCYGPGLRSAGLGRHLCRARRVVRSILCPVPVA